MFYPYAAHVLAYAVYFQKLRNAGDMVALGNIPLTDYETTG